MSVRRSLAALITLALSLLALGAGSAVAATPGEVTTFKVRGCLSGFSLSAAPGAGVLFRTCEKAAYTEGRTLGNLLPSGKLVQYGVPPSGGGPIVSVGADIWLVGGRQMTLLAADGSQQTFPIVTSTEPSPMGTLASIVDLAVGGEGKVWAAVAESSPTGYGYKSVGGELVGVAADGTETHFRLPEQIEPRGLALGPDGNLWFTGISGFASYEHGSDPGIGYVGRMTPTGEFTLFPTDPSPGGIAAGPDGRLWFTGPARSEVGTIGVDGTFGPTFLVRGSGYLTGSLTFGPEGDAWLAFEERGGGIVRVTPAGQQTVYPGWTNTVTTGREGDIWGLYWKEVRRIVPGGPGVDLWRLEADRATRKVHAELACGGSTSACHGQLELSLDTARKEEPTPNVIKAKLPFELAKVPYTVPAESHRTVTVKVPAAAFKLASRWRHRNVTPPLRVGVRATVEGGPTLRRWATTASLVGPG
jgi:virginiamycin B lyase